MVRPPDGAAAAPGGPSGARPPIGSLLIAILGPIAAAGLFVAIPAEESGRQVEATVQPTGSIAVRHISGPQYLQAYKDIVGIWTACDGIAYVKPGTYSEEQCAGLLEAHLVDHARHVMACTPGLRPIGHDQQRIAAVSLSYNIGWFAYCRSTVARRFNAGQYAGACDAFGMWNKAGGKVRRGLTLRRQREATRCRLDLPIGKPPLPMAPADYQQCVTVRLPPITAVPPGKFRTDYRTRDGGIA